MPSDILTADPVVVRGGDYEFTLAVGGAHAGTDLDYAPGDLNEIYAEVLNDRPFQACEFSLSNYTMMRDRGADWMRAVPVFMNRAFRQGIILVRKDSELREPKDLVGKRIGVRDYSQTAAVWLRGTLIEDYGVDWRDINWYGAKSQRFPTLSGVPLELGDGDPEDMTIAGELDAFFSPRARDLLKPLDEQQLRPLFDNVQAVERDYFQRTGIYPINHTVVVRDAVRESFPELPRAIFEGYTRSKRAAYKRRLGTTLVPWAAQHWTHTLAEFGGDPMPFGMTDENRKNVETLLRYLHEQTLVSRPWTVEELFVEGSLGWREEEVA